MNKERYEKFISRRFTIDELWDVRKQIVLNSIFTAYYKNDVGVSDSSMHAFFEGYVEYIGELAKEIHENYDLEIKDVFELDTKKNLYCWYLSADFEGISFCEE